MLLFYWLIYHRSCHLNHLLLKLLVFIYLNIEPSRNGLYASFTFSFQHLELQSPILVSNNLTFIFDNCVIDGGLLGILNLQQRNILQRKQNILSSNSKSQKKDWFDSMWFWYALYLYKYSYHQQQHSVPCCMQNWNEYLYIGEHLTCYMF